MNEQTVTRLYPQDNWKIPDRLNILLVVFVATLSLFWLWLGSHFVERWELLILCGIGYSYLMLTNYALLHEASHDKLHSNPELNYILSMITGFFFPMSATLHKNTHTKHHIQNRSEDELFDAYTESDSKVKKYIQWYAILIGIFWFYPVLGSIVLCFFSPTTVQKWFLDDRPGRAYSGNFNKPEIRKMSLELVLLILFGVSVIVILDLSLKVLLVYYLFTAINWSTRQFIEHAFTRRHFVEGSLNLKHFPWMSKLLLHRELDLNHHRYPDVPWNFLPELVSPDEPQIHYIEQYLRLWKGPVPASQLKP